MPPPFRYLRDPVFLVAVSLFLINKLLLKPHTGNWFVHGYVSDLLLIPVWLPPMLWSMRRLGLRRHDGPPRLSEILVPLLLWSWIFEVWLPQQDLPGIRVTADPNDVLAYVVGALVARLGWRWSYRSRSEAILNPPGFFS